MPLLSELIAPLSGTEGSRLLSMWGHASEWLDAYCRVGWRAEVAFRIRFGQFAPAPMLVNTSFNLFGEPLVVSPRDAVRSYFCSGVDALIIGSFSLTKT